MIDNDLTKLDSNFINLIHKTLKKRIPPSTYSEHLEDLINVLMESLSKGEIYIELNNINPYIELKAQGWPLDHIKALKSSGWLEGKDSPIILEGNLLSWRRWHEEMENIIINLKDRLSHVPNHSQRLKKEVSSRKQSTLNENQINAVEAVLNHNVILLSGGPGTGKTSTIVEMLLKALSIKQDLKIGLGAPTGKASRRLEETIQKSIIHLDDHSKNRLLDIPCTTLHRWLKANEIEFRKNEASPIQLDILVVDEMSMVDISLMKGLLKALPKESQLILVGDPDQLPPVGNGAVWHKLHEEATLRNFSNCAFRLNKVYRNRGDLVDLANKLRIKQLGDFFEDVQNLKKSSSVQVIISRKEEIPVEIIKTLTQHQVKLINKASSLTNSAEVITTQTLNHMLASDLLNCLEELMVLSPRRYGPWSVEHIHRTILEKTLDKGVMNWPPGTPVICGENQPELNLANGDIGIVIGGEVSNHLLFRLQSTRNSGNFTLIHPIRVRSLSPAFATTVHKAQGSEAEHVIFLWPEPINQIHSSNNNPLYNKEYERKLIYTAITRAKSKLDLAITLDK